MPKQTSDMEIMEMIRELSSHIDEKFDKLEASLVNRMDNGFDKVWNELNNHHSRLERIEANMVTKRQFNSLVHILRRNEVISPSDAIHVSYPVL